MFCLLVLLPTPSLCRLRPRLQYLLGAMREHTRTWRREHAELERQHLGKQNVLLKCIRYWQVCVEGVLGVLMRGTTSSARRFLRIANVS